MTIRTINQSQYNLAVSSSHFGPFIITTPISSAVSVTTAQTLTAVGTPQTLTLNNEGVGNVLVGLPIGLLPAIIGAYMVAPIVPGFFSSVAGNLYKVTISGANQFGDLITETADKTASGANTNFDFSAYSRIDSIVVTPTVLATPGVDTLSVGWDLKANTINNRFALPMRVRESADMLLQAMPVDLGGGTYGGTGGITLTASKAINTGGVGAFVGNNGVLTTRNTNFDKGVIAFGVGCTVQPTTPIKIAVWLKPESLPIY